ncbi:MAG: hypothetical protein QOJ39_503 [Candidatus Eremiobacteraeota bacterium]|jgi:hypothetical protein|nr:hypothetical protein [Candidatus Eremiobacteraeota bacterium]
MSTKHEPDAQDQPESLPAAAFEELRTNPHSLGGPAAAPRTEPTTHTTPHSLGSPEQS